MLNQPALNRTSQFLFVKSAFTVFQQISSPQGKVIECIINNTDNSPT